MTVVIDGNKTSDLIKLSDYVSTPHTDVRIVNLDGHTVEIDTTLDGEYEFPDQPKDAKWIGKAGREGVHTALLTIADGKGFTLRFTNKSEVRNSRGRGITVSNCHDFETHNMYVRGARTAGISHHDCSNFTAYNMVTVDTGNYQDAKGEGPNWPGSIKAESCWDYQFFRPISTIHLGNGITASSKRHGDSICRNGLWVSPVSIDISGVSQYINAAPNHWLRNGLHFGAVAGYAPNTEEEFTGQSEGFTLNNCHALCWTPERGWNGNAVGFWGGEGKGQNLDNAAVTNCVLVAETGIKYHRNSSIKNFDRTGTLVITSDSITMSQVQALYDAGQRIKAAVVAHEDNDVIDSLIDEARAMFVALNPVETKPDPIEVEPALNNGQVIWLRAVVDDEQKARKRLRPDLSVGGMRLETVSQFDLLAIAEKEKEQLREALQSVVDTVKVALG